MKNLTKEESLEKFLKDMTDYMIKKAKGDINSIPTYDDIKLGHYIEETEYNIIYERTMKSLKD